MKNFIYEGDALTLTAPYTVVSGAGAQVGSIFGVATSDVTSGDAGIFAIEGCFTLAKTTGTAWTVGMKLYWDDSGKKVTHTSNSAANIFIGHCITAAASGDTTGQVRLHGASA